MIIAVIEGLPLSGKTNVCINLQEYFKSNGVNSLYCPNGHLAVSIRVDEYYKKAFEYLFEWDFNERNSIYKFIEYGFLSLRNDYHTFLDLQKYYENVDLILLDRHFTGHIVTSEYFGFYDKYKYERPQIDNYY
jgi:thymidylate kinase